MRLILLSFLASFSLAFVALQVTAPAANAQNLKKNVCSGANISLDGEKNCNVDSEGEDVDNQGDINKLIKRIINILSVIVGIVAVIMIIYGGFKFITAGGNGEAISSART